MTDCLRIEDHGAVRRLILNRPKERNALDAALIDALGQALAVAGADPAIRAVVIAAEGPAFSAGHDLRELEAMRTDPDGGTARWHGLFARCGEVMRAIAELPKPVIAEVQGMATAAGCQLVASCDLALAAEDARFATPGVNIGLFCSTPAVALTRAVLRKAAAEMLLTGDPVSAADALRIGLVSRVVPSDRLTAETMALAERIAAKPSAVVALGKRALREQDGLPLADAYARMAAVMAANMGLPDAAEGISAFLEKRPPAWSRP